MALGFTTGFGFDFGFQQLQILSYAGRCRKKQVQEFSHGLSGV
jgi:hypothetical protein